MQINRGRHGPCPPRGQTATAIALACCGFNVVLVDKRPGAIHERTDAPAFKHHRRTNARVFVLGQGRRDDGANGIIVICGDGGARGDIPHGCCGAAAAATADDHDASDSGAADILC